MYHPRRGRRNRGRRTALPSRLSLGSYVQAFLFRTGLWLVAQFPGARGAPWDTDAAQTAAMVSLALYSTVLALFLIDSVRLQLPVGTVALMMTLDGVTTVWPYPLASVAASLVGEIGVLLLKHRRLSTRIGHWLLPLATSVSYGSAYFALLATTGVSAPRSLPVVLGVPAVAGFYGLLVALILPASRHTPHIEPMLDHGPSSLAVGPLDRTMSGPTAGLVGKTVLVALSR